jgi:CHAD domain-containing protein
MEAPPASDREIEWQLDAQDLRLVLRWIEVAADGSDGITITPGRTVTNLDTYVDTVDRRLDRAGFSVRLRRVRRDRPEATLKSLDAAGPDALRIRLELAERLDDDDPAAIANAPGPVGERVRALVGPRKLVPLFDLQTRRRSFPLAANGVPSGELLLDETAIREHGGPIVTRMQRVEVEVPESALGVIGPLVERMQRACGLHPSALSKYEAGLAANGHHRAEAADFGPTAVDPDDTIGQVALAILRRHFGVMLAKEPGTRLGDDIEELHDMRVASRRLRAAVSLFRDFLPAEAERLRPELAWVGQTIGAVRDLDVQLVQLDEWTEGLPEADRPPLVRLRAVLVEERAEARAAMLQALDSPRYERFVRRFGAMLRGRTGVRTRPARAVAPDLIEGRHRGLRKAMRKIGDGTNPEAFHRLRIVGKRFRYALEFLSDVYPGETKPLIRRTVELQDLLGDYQDGIVAIDRLRELATHRAEDLGPEAVFAMGEIAERYRSGMTDVHGRTERAYKRVSGKQWKRLRKTLEAARPEARVPAGASEPEPEPAPEPVAAPAAQPAS